MTRNCFVTRRAQLGYHRSGINGKLKALNKTQFFTGTALRKSPTAYSSSVISNRHRALDIRCEKVILY